MFPSNVEFVDKNSVVHSETALSRRLLRAKRDEEENLGHVLEKIQKYMMGV